MKKIRENFWTATNKTNEREIYLVEVIEIDEETILDSIENSIYMNSISKQRNILQYKNCFSNNQELWIFYEYIPNALTIERELELADKLKQTQSFLFSEFRIACILKDILLALNYLHNNLRIHGDVKSRNVFIDQLGSAKLCKFSNF
jgi:serine/threonine-protein kinase 24/25/MST4